MTIAIFIVDQSTFIYRFQMYLGSMYYSTTIMWSDQNCVGQLRDFICTIKLNKSKILVSTLCGQ